MKQPSSDFKTRYAAAKKWRDSARPYIEEIFRFCAPGREKDFHVRKAQQTFEVDTFHSLPEELAMDLASDLVTYYTPAEARWASYAVVSEVDEIDADVVRQIVQQREEDLFNLFAMSNYYDMAPQWGFEAATHGTPGMWISRSSISEEIHFDLVPPHELLLVPGHRGILDRFREKRVQATALKAELAGVGADLSDPKISAKMDKAGEHFTVVYGFWIDWSDPAFPVWKMEVTVDGHQVATDTLGPIAGACPLHVGRFNPQPGRPWGRGPGWKALPDMRTLDRIEEVVLTGMDEGLKNTIIYPDDGFLDLSEGLEAGRAYPASRGFRRDAIFELQKGTNLDYGFFTRESFENRLRAAFYQDGPRQTGDTPPTATQWIDERRRVQMRIGKPSAPLWSEMIVPMIQRVEYLGMEAGRIPEALSHNGQDILVMPISPLQKAQNADKVLIARSNLELAVGVFADQTAAVIDPLQTFRNIVEASGDELTTIRDQEIPQEAPPNG